MKALPAFDAGLGRPLSTVHIYQGWNDLTPDYLMRDALAAGAIPMIDWSCAPATAGYADSDAAVISGYYDSLIRSFAEQLAALKAPVFLRWYYEPNFPQSKSYAECIGSGGQPGDYGPVGYQRAFQHIHDIFQAAGAYNVAFVWAVDVNQTASQQQLDSYYPGAAYVDWIAADGYMDTATPGANAVQQMFGAWYTQFSTYGKPMMISETAAISGQRSPVLPRRPGRGLVAPVHRGRPDGCAGDQTVHPVPAHSGGELFRRPGPIPAECLRPRLRRAAGVPEPVEAAVLPAPSTAVDDLDDGLPDADAAGHEGSAHRQH